MISAGEVIQFTQTGEIFHFLQTTSDTQGHLLKIHMVVAPESGAKHKPVRFQPRQKERFSITQGELTFCVNGREFVVANGETVIIQRGDLYTWWNASGRYVEFIFEMKPALQWETIFETLYRLSEAGLLRDEGRGSMLQMAVALAG
jgi:uncharacterized cupin superfamily protein